MVSFDYTDIRILEALQSNAKINVKDLADQLKMTNSETFSIYFMSL